MGDDKGEMLISLHGVAPIRMVCVSAHVIYPGTIKSRRFLGTGSQTAGAVKWLCV